MDERKEMLNVVIFNNNSERFLLKTISSVMTQTEVGFNLFIIDLESARFNFNLIINELTKQREAFDGEIVVEEATKKETKTLILIECCRKYGIEGDILVMEAGDCFTNEKALCEMCGRFEQNRPIYVASKGKRGVVRSFEKVDKSFFDYWNWGSVICDVKWLLGNINKNFENFAIIDLLLRTPKGTIFENGNYIEGVLWKNRVHINMYEYRKYLSILEEFCCECPDLKMKGKMDDVYRKMKNMYFILEKNSLMRKFFFHDAMNSVKRMIIQNKKVFHLISSWTSISLHFVIFYMFIILQNMCRERFIYSGLAEGVCTYCKIAIPSFLLLHFLINEQDKIKKRINW